MVIVGFVLGGWICIKIAQLFKFDTKRSPVEAILCVITFAGAEAASLTAAFTHFSWGWGRLASVTFLPLVCVSALAAAYRSHKKSQEYQLKGEMSQEVADFFMSSSMDRLTTLYLAISVALSLT